MTDKGHDQGLSKDRTVGIMTKTDMRLKEDIQEELRWDPKVNAAQIAVSVDRGTVSLLGAVDSYTEKWAAENATKRVSGVRTIAQDLTVKLVGDDSGATPKSPKPFKMRWRGTFSCLTRYREGTAGRSYPRRAGHLELPT